ncbi:hypothetical protein [Bradyrhizobium sp. 2S1]|uniref:hypothetical protein n=1 Tax=Bradyrhizobium sp. 2S1 TaxID=1404429 RepID=UPI00140CB9CF|nr:hypothetical protein [Bradyrhizobium sp. 2S1]MCK7669834.1 hypothetical protein [Bradyrhizobium sp. 2S1]
MGLPARIALGIALACVSTLVARTAFEICYRSGFYPEVWFADLTMGVLSNHLAFWLLLCVTAFAVWIALEIAARRWLRAPVNPMLVVPQKSDDKFSSPVRAVHKGMGSSLQPLKS